MFRAKCKINYALSPVRSAVRRPGGGDVSGLGVSSVLLSWRVEDGEWGYSNGSVLLAGGSHGTSHEHSIDVYDPVRNAWLLRVDMGVRRHHPATTLLPDGRVLVLGGHDDEFPENPQVRQAQLIDTLGGRAVYRGSSQMPEHRGYHVVSILADATADRTPRRGRKRRCAITIRGTSRSILIARW